eukprot:SAG31_NODE_41730_length_274_cov_1.771429_1_plen_77_part_10
MMITFLCSQVLALEAADADAAFWPTVQSLVVHQLWQGPGKSANLRVLLDKYGPQLLEDIDLLRGGLHDFFVTTRVRD